MVLTQFQYSLSAWMGSVYLRMNNRHNTGLLWDEALHHNWRTDRKRLKYRAAFVRFWQIRIADTL
jgi:hypothetical protein